MKKIKFGQTDLEFFPLIFGGNVLGWTIDEKKSFELLNLFFENAFNCIDTADVYSSWVPGNKGGESETIIGNWMKQKANRKEMIIATKAGYGFGGNKDSLKKEYILKCAEASLKRLQTDYIDLYQMHVDDANAPQEETLEALDSLVKSGKVRHVGCSNFSAKRIESALKISSEKNLPHYISVQPEYNLYDREGYEKELQNFCVQHKLAVIPYFPLAAGFLSGKYKSEKDAVGKARGARAKKYMNARGFKIIETLEKIALTHEASPAEIALAWIRQQPGIAAPIASATNPEQLNSLMKSCGIELKTEELITLDKA